MPDTMSLLDAALSYAARGWPVFPIKNTGNGKAPATEHGYLDATADADQVRKWWTAGTRSVSTIPNEDGKSHISTPGNPRYNIGVSAGSISGVWVLDSDDGGEETVKAWAEEFGALPVSPTQVTPSGGIHRFFAWPSDGLDLPRRIRFAPGLDALGERLDRETGELIGGYYIVAPSVRKDGAYHWEVTPDDVEPPQAPDWLLRLIREDAAGQRLRPADMPVIEPVRSDRTSRYGRVALDALCSEIVNAPVGQQEVTLSKCALRVGSLAYGGSIDEREAFDAVLAAGMRMPAGNPRDPWTRGVIERKIRTAFATASLDPTPAPAKRDKGDAPRKPGRDAYEAADMSPPADGQSWSDMYPADAEAPPPAEYESAGEPDRPAQPKPKRKRRERDAANLPFRLLGFNREIYYYLPDGKGQVTTLKANAHTNLNLLQLAPLDFWQSFAGSDDEKLSGEQWQMIANSLIQRSHVEGIFDENRLRGRGAWTDDGRVVVHTGTEALVDGRLSELREIGGDFIYEQTRPMEFQPAAVPATTAEAHMLVDICNRLTWAEPISGALLAGWCVIATVCGALLWRSHIWITGSAGSGKTTALVDIVGRLVGPSAETIDGATTEAAIRQLLDHDARPVIMDEAEQEDQAAMARMQAVLGLARVASSGGKTVKGGQTGTARVYVVRACFCFSSINTALRHSADESRVSRLVLVPNTAADREQHYESLMRDIHERFTPDYASAMFARTVQNLPTLLANAATFTRAAAIAFHSRRAADQLGPMLAGYYLCHSTGLIDLEDAQAFIARHKWDDHVSIDAATDERRLFQYLMSRTIRINQREVSVGQGLEMIVGSNGMDADSSWQEVERVLSARGIKLVTTPEGSRIAFANKADGIRDMLKDQPQWSSDWKRPLSVLPGATRTENAIYFAAGLNSRAVLVPVMTLMQ